MTAMFIGLVSTYIGRYLGGFVSENGLFTFHGDYIPLVVMAVSALVMAGFVYLIEKKESLGGQLFHCRKHDHRHGGSGAGGVAVTTDRTTYIVPGSVSSKRKGISI